MNVFDKLEAVGWKSRIAGEVEAGIGWSNVEIGIDSVVGLFTR